MLYSCNVLPGAKEDNNNSTTVAGLAVLAASQRTSSGRAALVMPDCGKGTHTGETYGDYAKYGTLFNVGYSVFGYGVMSGCTPKSISSTFPQSATLTYTANRQLATYTSSGSTTTYSYNGLNYILNKSTPCTVTSAGNSTIDYGYDSSGRLTKITYTTPAGCNTGSAAFLLVEEYAHTGSDLFPSAGTQTYNSGVCKTTSTYTITKTTQGWIEKLINNSSNSGTATVNSCVPGQSSQNSVSYTYDSNGNILTNVFVSTVTSTFTYTFDSSSRIATYTAAGTTTSYTYSSSGQLTSSVSGNTTTTYSY